MSTDLSIETGNPVPVRYTGIVRWFAPEKGFGFIKVENQHDIVGTKEFFCHYTGIRGKSFRNLLEGQLVEFEIVQGPKGDQANDTVILAQPEPVIQEEAA